MDLLDLTLPTPEENLALAEALLVDLEARSSGVPPDGHRREGARETLRHWESASYFVVLGVAGKAREEVEVDACRELGIPVLRRASGGGAVLLGPGCLNYSLLLSLDVRPELRDIGSSYRAILTRVSAALSSDGAPSVGTAFQGISDVALDGRKVSGNAQKRTRNALLHHGTILFAFDLPLMERLLRHPPRQPEYRRDRIHSAFVRNVGLENGEIRKRISSAWDARPPSRTFVRPDLTPLIDQKYGNRDWIDRF